MHSYGAQKNFVSLFYSLPGLAIQEIILYNFLIPLLKTFAACARPHPSYNAGPHSYRAAGLRLFTSHLPPVYFAVSTSPKVRISS